MKRLEAICKLKQSIWLDYIRRGMTRSGELAEMVGVDRVRGVTSNPSIFQKAIGESDDYDEALAALLDQGDLSTKALYEALAIEDIQEACDALRSVYDATDKADGFVSLEVAPALARNAEGTISEARKLWGAVSRPNLMIKVPGTPEGIVAVEQLITDGINVNVTLIFARDAYERIADAYVRGLEARDAAGKSVNDVASVASFFVSRIDVAVDKQLVALQTAQPDKADDARRLAGKIAIANARVAYRGFESRCAGDRWKALAAKGARPQRLLWASTGTKNPDYPDTLYVDSLIGPETVNTVPPKTLTAFIDHGTVAQTLTEDVDAAEAQLAALGELGISLDAITDDLLAKGLLAFEASMDQLLATVARARRSARGGTLNRTKVSLPADLADAAASAGKAWSDAGNTEKLWNKDASLWTGGDEARWLGWLDIIDAQQRGGVAQLRALADEVANSGFEQVLLLGMGGSSLGPDVLSKTFGARTIADGGRRLGILDSTVPAQVSRVHKSVDPKTTLFIVASKSGSTLEPTAFMQSFLARAKDELGGDAGKHFIAITDPGSKLEAFANEHGFRKIFHGVPEIGGRFSAWSHFGLVPAAAMGLDVEAMLAEAQLMAKACRLPEIRENPGVELGLVLGAAAKAGRDKLTIVASPPIASFGGWMEQLVAESTGKGGQAIIPVDGERPTAPAVYGSDRVFVYLRLASTPSAAQDAAVAALEAAQHPVVRIELDDVDALSQEFFRWQIATAVAGAVMELHPFDQPDVEASKVASRALTNVFEETGALPTSSARFSGSGIEVHTDDSNAAALGSHDDLAGYLRAHLGRLADGDYFGALAYVDMNPAHEGALAELRHVVRDAKRVATCVGFGPRFLHSTGQAYKGGPNSGVFIQITADDAEDRDVPGFKASFGVMKQAQASGDFQVLCERGRRAIRVHLGADVERGLATLTAAVRSAVGGE